MTVCPIHHEEVMRYEVGRVLFFVVMEILQGEGTVSKRTHTQDDLQRLAFKCRWITEDYL